MKITEIAEQIYQAELIINNSKDKEQIKKAKKTIDKLSNQVKSLDDLFFIDDWIQKKLKK